MNDYRMIKKHRPIAAVYYRVILNKGLSTRARPSPLKFHYYTIDLPRYVIKVAWVEVTSSRISKSALVSTSNSSTQPSHGESTRINTGSITRAHHKERSELVSHPALCSLTSRTNAMKQYTRWIFVSELVQYILPDRRNWYNRITWNHLNMSIRRLGF
jgi:hypothetical protein